MDPLLKEHLKNEAQRQNVRLDESFISHLDSYVDKFFPQHSRKDQVVVQTYLGEAGLRIAKTEGKRVAQLDDAKAAIYYFHLPDDPDSPPTCMAAGNKVLREERRRPRYQGGRLINENLRQMLDQMK
jgi:hypothetical protein